MLLATRHSACVAKVGATNQLKALIVGAPEELRAELILVAVGVLFDETVRLECPQQSVHGALREAEAVRVGATKGASLNGRR